jgi:hypothetical protein
MKTLIALILAVALLALPLNADTSGNQAMGSPVTFSVTVGSGTLPFTYQWKKNGVNIVGATAATYTIAAVAAGDAGTYTVAVSNKAGAVTSDNGVFTLTVAPGGVTVTITTP